MTGITPMFFGQYLLEKGSLTKDQLIESINYQKSKILKLGEIALDRKLLTEKEIAKIHNEQKRTDMRFGDLAVKMKLLTAEQLGEIITIQKNNHIYLGEAIVACGHMDQTSIDRELQCFKEEQKSVPPIEVMIQEDVPQKELVEICVDLTEKMMRRVGDMISKSGQVRTESGSVKNLGVASTLKFRGDIIAKYILNLSWEVGHEIARKTFKKEDLPFDEELIADTISEFVNIVCGNVRSKMIETGKKIDIIPPTWATAKAEAALALKETENATVIPGYTTIGNYEVAIVTKD